MEHINILIGTPAYNGQLHIDYLNTVLGLSNKIKFDVMNIGNESLITRGRNAIISHFIREKKYTHLLFLDADIGLHPQNILKLLNWDKDVIGAPVPMKGFVDGHKQYNCKTVAQDDSGLWLVDWVGTAVFMLSRKACEDLIKDADTYVMHNTINYDVFQVGVKDNIYLSEDYWVCVKLRELGYSIYVDDTIEVKHNGMYRF